MNHSILLAAIVGSSVVWADQPVARSGPLPLSAPASTPAGVIPSWFPKAPPLPRPVGEIIPVSSPDELLGAVDRLKPGGTILLADGQYTMPRVMVLRQLKDITLRSAAGDPTKVTLSGKG